jgi:chromate reductase
LTIHIVGFTGSIRKGSFNRATLETARELLPSDVELEIISIGDLPLFNQDLETNLPEPVVQFREKIRNADGLLISSPEHNHSMPAALKNALDWSSRPVNNPIMRGKPTAVMAGGANTGAVRAMEHVRQVLLHLEVNLVNKPEVLFFNIWNLVNEEGKITDPTTLQFMNTMLQNLVALIRQTKADLALAH